MQAHQSAKAELEWESIYLSSATAGLPVEVLPIRQSTDSSAHGKELWYVFQ